MTFLFGEVRGDDVFFFIGVSMHQGDVLLGEVFPFLQKELPGLRGFGKQENP